MGTILESFFSSGGGQGQKLSVKRNLKREKRGNKKQDIIFVTHNPK